MTNIVSNFDEKIHRLPDEIKSIIFYFIPRCGTAKIIKYVIDIYEKDHNYDLTKMYKMYYVKNIMSFSQYIHDNRYYSEFYDYGSKYYNDIKMIKIYYTIEDFNCDKST
jgi:hypothetical protein